MSNVPFVAPWVAHRTYRHNDECRSAISNEKDRELIVLEDEAANLWDEIAKSEGQELEVLTQRLGYPSDEAQGFIDELVDIGLLVADKNQIPEFVETVGYESAPASRITGVLGTDDLDIEFDFQDWAKDRGYLWATSWELTYRCNEKCLHCYNPGASHDHSQKSRRGTQELKDGEWQKLLDDMKDLGVFRLALTGGEVLERTDFFEILKYARKCGFSVSLLSNGLAITADVAKRIAECWPHRIEMSLYSHIPERHDAITAIEGSHHATVEATKHLKELGQSVTLKMVIMKDTRDDVAGFKELSDSLGCEGLVDSTISVGNDGSHDTYKNLRVDSYGLIHSALDPKHPMYCGPKDQPKNGFKYADMSARPCGAGHATLSVSPEGNIYPCLAFPKYIGSVREEGLKKVWVSATEGKKTTLSDWQKVTLGSFDRCGKYERCSWCSKCAGASFLETGDETSPNTVKCRTAAAKMLAHQYVTEGGTYESFSNDVFNSLKSANPHEYSLWTDDASIVARIDLDAVRKTISTQSRQRVLQNHSQGDAS